MSDKSRGVYEKFTVKRTDGRSRKGEKHHGCQYFVLDLDHDKFAADALDDYAEGCAEEYTNLSADVRAMAEISREKTDLVKSSGRCFWAVEAIIEGVWHVQTIRHFQILAHDAAKRWVREGKTVRVVKYSPALDGTGGGG